MDCKSAENSVRKMAPHHFFFIVTLLALATLSQAPAHAEGTKVIAPAAGAERISAARTASVAAAPAIDMATLQAILALLLDDSPPSITVVRTPATMVAGVPYTLDLERI